MLRQAHSRGLFDSLSHDLFEKVELPSVAALWRDYSAKLTWSAVGWDVARESVKVEISVSLPNRVVSLGWLPIPSLRVLHYASPNRPWQPQSFRWGFVGSSGGDRLIEMSGGLRSRKEPRNRHRIPPTPQHPCPRHSHKPSAPTCGTPYRSPCWLRSARTSSISRNGTKPVGG